MKRLMGILCVLVALPADADTIGDLKSAVNRLEAKQPVRATYATELAVKTAGRFANEKTERNVSVEVVQDASGVSITIPQALIDKASQEAHSRSGEWDNAARNAIASISSINVVEALDFSDSLMGMLNYGAVIEEMRVAFRGRTARLLVLKLSQPPRTKNGIQIGSVKVDQDRLNVWVGDDNLPLAAERIQKTTGGFMIFHADSASRTSYTFAHTADRLILTRLETSVSGSGMGQNVDTSSVQTMTLH